MNEMSRAEAESLLVRQIEALHREQERLRIATRYLQDALDLLPVLDSELNRIRIEHLKPMWRLNLSMMEKADNDPALQQEKQKWLELMPATFWVSKIPYGSLCSFESELVEYAYGLMCYEEDARKLGLRRSPYVELVPGGDYAVMYHKKADRGPWVWEDVRPMLEFLSSRGQNSFGDGFSYVVNSEKENGISVNYHKMIVKLLT